MQLVGAHFDHQKAKILSNHAMQQLKEAVNRTIQVKLWQWRASQLVRTWRLIRAVPRVIDLLGNL